MKNRQDLLLGAMLLLAIQFCTTHDSYATMYAINLNLRDSSVVPPVSTNGTASLTGTYNDVTNELTFTVNFQLLSGVTTAAHFHGEASPTENAGILINWTGFPLGVTSGTYSNTFVLLPYI